MSKWRESSFRVKSPFSHESPFSHVRPRPSRQPARASKCCRPPAFFFQAYILHAMPCSMCNYACVSLCLYLSLRMCVFPSPFRFASKQAGCACLSPPLASIFLDGAASTFWTYYAAGIDCTCKHPWRSCGSFLV